MFDTCESHSVTTFSMMQRCRPALSQQAIEKIRKYLLSQFDTSGGFLDRGGEADLYYTTFGLMCGIFSGVDLPLKKIEGYVRGHNISDMSMIDLACLAKCFFFLRKYGETELTPGEKEVYTRRMEFFRTDSGSFSYDGKGRGFPYAVFLAVNFYQDLTLDVPEKERILEAIRGYRDPRGTFKNPEGTYRGLLLSTVAAIQVIRCLEGKTDAAVLEWIRSLYSVSGGFCVSPERQIPDILSTAVALFILAVCGESMEPYRERSLKFIDGHWDECGGFRATVTDDICDCEYTYYGLLALGSLYGDGND